MLDIGVGSLRLDVVIANAEPLFDYQREAIARVFSCPVRETYGMAETVAAASECEAGQMHLWPESGVHEVMDAGEPVPPGTPGELIATGLLNPDMPLVRYRVGDRVTFAEPADTCPCGRTLPLLRKVEGRIDDVILTPDGRRVGRLDPVFKGGMPVVEAQIVQETHRRLRVLVVPSRGYNEATGQEIAQRLRDRVGEMEISVEVCKSIARSRNGKFRAVVSLVGRGVESSEGRQ